KGSSPSGSPGVVSANNELTARIIPSKTKLYEGEHLTLTYKIYSPFNIRQITELEFPSHSGFWKKSLSDAANRSHNVELENINGRRFQVVVIEQEILIAKQSGELTIDNFEIGTVLSDGWRTKRVNAKSNTLKITVLPLPENNRPSDFSGAVGKFNIKAEISKNDISEGDDGVDLKIIVGGLGNIEFIDDPEIILPNEFNVFPPETD